MKKLVSLLLVMVCLLSVFTPVSAAPEVCGIFQNSDITAYINNYYIPSYVYNGQVVVLVEDLRYYGFDVVWNELERSLRIYRNKDKKPDTDEYDYAPYMNLKSYAISGSKAGDMYKTNIRVFPASSSTSPTTRTARQF